MKALTLSEAARRNFFEIQNSSSELKVSLEVVGWSGTFEVAISKGMSLFFSPNGDRTRGPFLESPETFRAYFGWHNSLYIFKTKASRGTKLCSYFYFLFPLERIKRPALQNKQVVVLRMAFRTRKVLGPFEKRSPGARFSKVPKLSGWHNSLFIFKTKAFRATKLCSYFFIIPFTTYEKPSFTE